MSNEADWSGGFRLFRPMVLGVPTGQLAAKLWVMTLPKADEVTRHLDRPLVRCPELNDKRKAPERDGGTGRHTKEVLEIALYKRRLMAGIMNNKLPVLD